MGKNIVEISWNENNIDEVELAKKKFKKYRRQGWFAYVEMQDGTKRIIYDFHPSYGKMFFVHVVTGG